MLELAVLRLVSAWTTAPVLKAADSFVVELVAQGPNLLLQLDDDFIPKPTAIAASVRWHR